MLRRTAITTLLALLVVSGAGTQRFWFGASGDAGVPLESVLADYGCLVPQTVQAAEPAPWPEAWADANILGGDVSPARVVRDPWPTFHSVAVDAQNDRVFFSDSNRHGIWSYDRRAGSIDGTEPAEPITGVRGPATGMMFVASIVVDPPRREIYTVDNDIGDRLLTFSYDANGNARPVRSLHVPHQAWGIALSEKRQEVAVSVEGSRLVVVYRKGSVDETKPVRTLRGVKTGLADPHGVVFDDAHDEMIVANHGNQTWGPPAANDALSRGAAEMTADTPLGGRWLPPSIRVFASNASGDAIPTRIIEGDQTGLDWPMGVALDRERDELAVANNGSSSILVFRRDQSGNAKPIRVLTGDKTGIVGPMNVAIDTKNDELWVSNYGDHTALVFPRTATGNVAPKRVLRNAPAGAPTSGFGNPGAVTYDTKRREILVPN